MVPAIVLAAGLSRRMGGTSKALLTLPGGHTFLERIVEAFSQAGVPDVVVVAGHESDRVEETVRTRRLPARVVVNPDYQSGQLSSLHAGLAAIDGPEVRATLLTLVDVPLLSAHTVRRVLDHFNRTGAPIVRPVSGSLHGHPVCIRRDLFTLLRHADPAVGAKAVVRAHVSVTGDLPVDDPWAFRDVDTPDDYALVR